MKRAVDVLFGGDDGSCCSYRAKSPKMLESAPAAFKECKHLPQGQLAAVVLMSHAQVSIKLDQVNMKLGFSFQAPFTKFRKLLDPSCTSILVVRGV